MARIFITGSSDGLGLLTATDLIKKGHKIVLHARNEQRAHDMLTKVNGAADVLIGDLSSIAETKKLAENANALGTFDVVIHNAGLYQVPENSVGAEGLSLLLTVNSLAPYILTKLMNKSKRLIFMSSGMHLQGKIDFDALSAGNVSYSDTKLHDLILAKFFANQWPDVYSNAIDPGWVPTKMGGAGAPDSLEKGFETQVWLAESNDADALVTGKYFHHKKQAHYLTISDNREIQNKLINYFEGLL